MSTLIADAVILSLASLVAIGLIALSERWGR